jgi:hypothetical protein
MFVENHEKHPLPLLNPGGVTCFRPHDGYGDQHVAPPGLMRGGENIHHFLQTYRSSGAKILHHLMTELRCEKHIVPLRFEPGALAQGSRDFNQQHCRRPARDIGRGRATLVFFPYRHNEL